MSTIPYLKTTTTGLYKYRRRLPKDLEGFFNSKELIRSLGNNEIEATKKALSITSVLNEAIELTKLSSIPKSVIFDLLSDKLQLKSTTVKPKPQDKSKLPYLSKLYIEQSDVSVLEHSKRIYFLQSLLPSLLEVLFKKNDLNINSLSYEKILMIRKLLVKMPNMNYGNFKTMNLTSLISRLHKNTLVIPEKHLVSTETVLENYRCIDSWTQTFIGWPDETDLLEVSSNIQMLTYELPMMHVSQAILESNNYNNVTYKNNMIELNKYMRKEIENYCDGLVNNNKTLLTDYFALLNENIYYLEDEAMIHNVQKPMDRYLSYGEKKILNETELLNIKLDKLLSINKVSM